MRLNKNFVLVIGVLLAAYLLTSHIGYVQIQERLVSVIELADDTKDSVKDQTDEAKFVIQVDPVTTSTSSGEEVSENPLSEIKDTFTIIQNKVESYTESVGTAIQYFIVLVHHIKPVNAP